MLRTLLFRPGDFFEKRRDDLNGVTGGLLLLGFAVATTTVLALVLFVFTRLLPGEVGTSVWSGAVASLPVQFFGLLAVTLGLSVVLYFGAKLSRGSAGFGATVEITAWGLLPMLIAVLVGALTFLVFASQADISVATADQLVTAVDPIQSGLSGLVLLLVFVAGSAWEAYIWAGGLRTVHRLHRYGAIVLAVVVATLPVLLL